MYPTQHFIHFEGQNLKGWQLGGNGGVFLLCAIDSLLAHDRKHQIESYILNDRGKMSVLFHFDLTRRSLM
jgi:hypothetical protein